MWNYVRRNPGLVAAVLWLLLLSPVGQVIKQRGDARSHVWATAVLVGATLAGVASWLIMRRAMAARPGRDRAVALVAIAVAPIVAAVSLGFAGAARWSLLAAWGVCGALLVVWVLTVVADDRAPRS